MRVIASTNAYDVVAANEYRVAALIANAARKFAHRRWADIQIVVLDRASPMIRVDLVADAVATLPPEGLVNIEEIAFVDGSELTVVRNCRKRD